MCLIVKQTASNPLTREESDAIYRRNRDGFGVAWHDDDGTVQYWRRVPVDADDAWMLYQSALALATEARPVVLHWRMATHGRVVDELAHPFGLPGATLIHNGVLPYWGSVAAPGQSDTAALADAVAAIVTRAADDGMTPEDVYGSDPFRAWLAKEAQGSAILIVRKDGVIDHYGNAGLVHADRWMSNTYAGPASIYPPRPVSPVSPWSTWRGWDDDTDRPALSSMATALTKASRKRAALKRVRSAPPSPSVDPRALIAGGLYLPPMTIRAAAETLAAVAPAGSGWFLLDEDIDVVRWGIEQFAETLTPHVGFAIRVVDLTSDRVLIRVVDMSDASERRRGRDDPPGWC